MDTEFSIKIWHIIGLEGGEEDRKMNQEGISIFLETVPPLLGHHHDDHQSQDSVIDGQWSQVARRFDIQLACADSRWTSADLRVDNARHRTVKPIVH